MASKTPSVGPNTHPNALDTAVHQKRGREEETVQAASAAMGEAARSLIALHSPVRSSVSAEDDERHKKARPGGGSSSSSVEEKDDQEVVAVEKGIDKQKYIDGREFFGELENDLPNGLGQYKYLDGAVHVGCNKDGMCHGVGVRRYSNGEIMLGSWEKGVLTGEIILTQKGSLYIGEQRDGRTHGKGAMLGERADYIGEWERGLASGIGKLIRKDGTVFVGEFVNDKKHGKGQLVYSDGRKFLGTWKDDNIYSGMGAILNPDGTYFSGKIIKGQRVSAPSSEEGKSDGIDPGPKPADKDLDDVLKSVSDFVSEAEKKIIDVSQIKETKKSFGTYFLVECKNDPANAQGECRYSNGARYIGYFKNQLRHGYGVLIHPDVGMHFGLWEKGVVKDKIIHVNTKNDLYYIGQYKDGKKHGVGTNITQNLKYVGEWKNGLPDGKGEYTYSDGSVHKGRFTKGLKDGPGATIYRDGRGFSGEWKADLPLNGKGTFLNPKVLLERMSLLGSSEYTGEIRNGMMHGQGTLKINGRAYTVNWKGGISQGEGKCNHGNGFEHTISYDDFVKFSRCNGDQEAAWGPPDLSVLCSSSLSAYWKRD